MAGRKPRARRPRRQGQESYRRLLYQLAVCLVLFAATFLGRSALPESLRSAFRSDTDFVGAFSSLGQSISAGTPVGEGLENFAAAVFGASNQIAEPMPPVESPPEPNPQPAEPTENATVDITQEPAPLSPDPGAQAGAAPAPEPSPAAAEEITPILPPSPTPAYTGKALPPKASMEQVELGLAETALPVMGAVSSDFGWRIDPFTEEETFHYGADIAAEAGTEIRAFAAGVVEYIGEAEDFGLYMKIQHDGGVSSFYAHCGELYYRKGASIAAGQVIALVGNSGRSTGPHLHVEIKAGETYLNPLHYLALSD